MPRLLKANEVVNAGYVTNGQGARMDSGEIEPYLPRAERYWVASEFPPAMWADMAAKRTEDNINYSAEPGEINNPAFPNDANYEALFYGYMYRCIVLAALYDSWEGIALKTSALGITQAQPRNGINADFDVVKQRKNTIGNDLRMCINEMIEYLDNNKADFPLWTVSSTCKKENRNVKTFNTPIL
jgi:hypothetical protein